MDRSLFEDMSEKKKAGRPSSYSQEMADAICDRLATTELGLEEILERIKADFGHTVSIMAVWRWRRANEDFKAQFEDARKMQAQLLHDRAQRYAREPLIGRIEKTVDTPKGTETHITIADNVERSKLLVQTTLKRAGQLDGKYGDKLDLNHSGAVGVTLLNDIPRPNRD